MSVLQKTDLRLPKLNEDDIRRYSKEMNEPEWLLESRLKSFELFRKLQPEISPLFQKYADLSGVSLDSYEYLRTSRKSSVTPTFEELGNPNFVVQAGGNVLRVPQELLEKGVIIETIQEALERHQELFKRVFLNKVVKSESDKFAAFANALFDTGVFVYVPRNTTLEEPISLVYLTDGTNSAMVSQTIIYLEPNSFAAVVEEGYSISKDTGKPLVSVLTDIQLEDASRLAFSSFNGFSKDVRSFSNKKARVGRDSTMNWTFAYMGSAFTRGRLENIMAGQGGSADDIEVLFGDGDQRFDMASDITFVSTNSTGAVYVKAALKDSARALNRGVVKITENAKKSSAFLSIHSMLLSRNAVADAIPTLEIDNNDVKATHSAAVEQIDEEKVFYLGTKGLDEETSKRLIILAFFEKAVERIPSPSLRMKIRSLVEHKWRGSVGEPPKVEEDIFEWALQFGKVSPISDIFGTHYKYRTTVEKK
jgi:Fe-S cluster assembly protein SufB/Fe-S cluster assembly protein SufD